MFSAGDYGDSPTAGGLVFPGAALTPEEEEMELDIAALLARQDGDGMGGRAWQIVLVIQRCF